MTRPLFYAKSWFRAKKRATELWSAGQARAAHRAGATYTVLVDSPDRPSAFIDVTPTFVGVSFLDDRLREGLTYQFQLVEPGSLFLSMATHREFDGESDRVRSGTSYMFGRDGTVRIRREHLAPHRLETATSTTDVSGNHTAAPEFGNYDGPLAVDVIGPRERR